MELCHIFLIEKLDGVIDGFYVLNISIALCVMVHD